MSSKEAILILVLIIYSAAVTWPLKLLENCKEAFESEIGISVILSAVIFLELQAYCWWTIARALFKKIQEGNIELNYQRKFHRFVFFWCAASVLIGILILLELYDASNFNCSRQCLGEVTIARNVYHWIVLLTAIAMALTWIINLKYYLIYSVTSQLQRGCAGWATFIFVVLALMISTVKLYRLLLNCSTPKKIPILLSHYPSYICYFLAFVGLIFDKLLTDSPIFHEAAAAQLQNELSLLGVIGLLMVGFSGGIYYFLNEFVLAIEIKRKGCGDLRSQLYLHWVMTLIPIFYNICYFIIASVYYFISRSAVARGALLIGNRARKLLERMRPYKMQQILEQQKVVYSNKECLVCLEEFSSSKSECYLINTCKHLFHYNCLKNWIKLDKVNCPACRTQISLETTAEGI